MFQGKRKTALDVLAVRTEGRWVCVDTRLANALTEEALKAKAVPGLWPYDAVVPESAHGRSRFDFLLPRGRMRGYVEVKSVTLVAGGVALFPDAPTLRGARHVDDLLALRRRGYGAAVLFLVHRDALVLRPNDATDPAFGTALRRAARGGVFVLAHRTVFDGRTLSLGPPLPVDLRPPPLSVGAA
jgi:sugar fermentation stimulation protein A